MAGVAQQEAQATLLDKVISWDEKFAACNWASKEEIIGLLPEYIQEQQKNARNKKLNNNVNIEYFSMKTPFGDRYLLKDTKLVLEAKKRQGLFGENSTGKSLLFHNMANSKIKEFPTHLHVHHCKELETHELSESVLDTVLHCYPYMNILKKLDTKIQQVLAEKKADESCPQEEYEAIRANADFITTQLKGIGGLDAEDRAKKMLRVLGFDEVGMARQCSALSGGLRMRVALCMAFFIQADLLLLDEPTNHLDFPSVLWLENRLRGYKGAFLLVSHDRELLNNVCTSVILIEDLKLHYYNMGFKEFERTKALEDKKKFDEIEKFLQKNRNVDPSTFAGKQKAEKQQWSENYYQRQIAMQGKFTFPAPTPLENPEKLAPEDISLIKVEDVRFSYDASTGHWIFNQPISFNVTASTRCGVMGPNGAGKSTFLKLITHKLTANAGKISHHPNFILAYFGQHSTAELDLEMTPAEFMAKSFPNESTGQLRNHLAKTSIVGGTQDTRIKALSFSQRSCIIFAKLTYVCPHLLILDEPTNFLDLPSVDSLIAACNKYTGALLLVSHNRDFLKKCAKQYLSIVPGKFEVFNEMKRAENATYSFIQEMEEGGKIGANALKDQPSGASVHPSQRVGGAEEAGRDPSQPKTLTIGSSAIGGPKNMTGPKKEVYKSGETVLCLWTDGKYYPALIKKISPDGKYTCTFTEYGNTVAVAHDKLKKYDATAEKKKTLGNKKSSAGRK